jgi:hemolysin III
MREPFNSISHGLSAFLALVYIVYLIRINRRSLIPFGLGAFLCYGMSAIYHGAPTSLLLNKLDHIGIYLLIVCTYIPISNNIIKNGWTLTTIATLSLIGMVVQLMGGWMLIGISTILYLLIGWTGLMAYGEISRKVHGKIDWLIVGGILYTVGAIINVTQIVPYAHETFHMFSIVGTICHVIFLHITTTNDYEYSSYKSEVC